MLPTSQDSQEEKCEFQFFSLNLCFVYCRINNDQIIQFLQCVLLFFIFHILMGKCYAPLLVHIGDNYEDDLIHKNKHEECTSLFRIKFIISESLSCLVILFKFSPTCSCVSLLRPTSSSG